jgi:hypothetical protein
MITGDALAGGAIVANPDWVVAGARRSSARHDLVDRAGVWQDDGRTADRFIRGGRHVARTLEDGLEVSTFNDDVDTDRLSRHVARRGRYRRQQPPWEVWWLRLERPVGRRIRPGLPPVDLYWVELRVRRVDGVLRSHLIPGVGPQEPALPDGLLPYGQVAAIRQLKRLGKPEVPPVAAGGSVSPHGPTCLGWAGFSRAWDLGGLPLPNGETRSGALILTGVFRPDRSDPDPVWQAGVRTVIHIRREVEAATPSALSTLPGHRDLPLDAGAPYWPPTVRILAEQTRYLVDEKGDQVAQILKAIAQAPPGGVVIHDSGPGYSAVLIATLLLGLAGVHDSAIVAAFRLEVGNTPPAVVTDLLGHIDRNHGGILAYLGGIGIDPTTEELLVRRMVVGPPQWLYHYTNGKALQEIVRTNRLNPSLKAVNPAVRFGNGQYVTDIPPGTRTLEEFSFVFVHNRRNAAHFTHYVAVDVSGWKVFQTSRDHVLLLANSEPLDLKGRGVKTGSNVPAEPREYHYIPWYLVGRWARVGTRR